MGLCRLGMQRQPCHKHPKYWKISFVSAQFPLAFTLGTPGKRTSLPLPAWVTLLCVLPMYASHWRAWFQKHGPEYVVQMDDIVMACRKGSILTKLNSNSEKNNMPAPVQWRRPCSSQQFLPIVKNFVFYPLIPGPKLGSISTHKVYPIVLGFGMRTQIIQIVCSVEEVGIVPLLACEFELFRYALDTHWQILQLIQKVKILHNRTKKFTTAHYQLRGPSQFRKPCKKKLCVVSTRFVWNNINLVREWWGPLEIMNTFTYSVLPERMDTLPTLFTIGTQIIHGFTFRTHFLSFSRAYVHSVSRNTYKNLSDSMLGLSGVT